MKAYLKKITALSMAALLVLSLAACGGNDDEPSTDPSGDSAIVDNSEDVNTPDASDDTDASEDASGDTDADPSNNEDPDAPTDPDAPSKNDPTSSKNDPTKPTGGNNNPSTPAKTSLTKQEALDLFNKATVGKSMKGLRKTKVNLNKLPGSLDKYKGDLEKTIAERAADKELSRFENQTLTMNDVKNVTAVKSGNNWKITISVKDGYAANAKAFLELPKDEIDGWVKKLMLKPADALQFNYRNSTIVATVTPDGKVVNAEYTMKVNVHVDNGKVFGFVNVSNVDVDVTQIDKF